MYEYVCMCVHADMWDAVRFEGVKGLLEIDNSFIHSQQGCKKFDSELNEN